MNFKIVNPITQPELKAGQLWKNVNNGVVYLAVKSPKATYGSAVILVNTKNGFDTYLGGDDGFGNNPPSAFEYLGELRLTD